MLTFPVSLHCGAGPACIFIVLVPSSYLLRIAEDAPRSTASTRFGPDLRPPRRNPVKQRQRPQSKEPSPQSKSPQSKEPPKQRAHHKFRKARSPDGEEGEEFVNTRKSPDESLPTKPTHNHSMTGLHTTLLRLHSTPLHSTPLHSTPLHSR